MDNDPFSIEDTLHDIKRRKRLGDPALGRISPDIQEKIAEHAGKHINGDASTMLEELDQLLNNAIKEDKSPQYSRGYDLGIKEKDIVEIEESSFDKHGYSDENDILLFQKGYLVGRVKAMGEEAVKRINEQETNDQANTKSNKTKPKRKVRKIKMPYGGAITLLLTYGVSFIAALAYLKWAPW